MPVGPVNPETCEIKQISLLRIDVDAYSATLEVLDALYDKVQTGGYIIFDDSSLEESLDAIRYFFDLRKIPFFLYHPITNEKIDISAKQPQEYESGVQSACYLVKS